MVVMIVRYVEINKLTGSTLGFGKTLLSASYSIFLTSVLTSLYSPRAPALASVEHMDVSPCVENDMHEVKEDAKKRKSNSTLQWARSHYHCHMSKVFYLLISSV